MTNTVGWPPRELCLVDPATGELLCACPAADARPIVDLRFSADGRRLIVLRETGLLQIWDVALIRRHLQTAGIDLHPSSYISIRYRCVPVRR
ncbi:MAG TPA: hypothetical protein VF278_11630 [Pirellulales bacterium]